MWNIIAMIPIDISIKPRIAKNIHVRVSCSPYEIKIYTALFKEFHDFFVWSYEEIYGIDPSIGVNEIPTYPNVKSVR